MKYLTTGLLASWGLLMLTAPLRGQLMAQVMAQVNPVTESQQALQELRQDNSGNIFGGNGTTGIMQLIHNANLLNGKSPAQVRSQQAESIDQSVQEFRQRQKSRQSGQSSPDTITKPLSPNTK